MTMWTIKYRGFWIHGYTDKDEVRVQDPDQNMRGTWRTLQAAKRMIALWVPMENSPYPRR